jgi:3',5'-nucleoside bisphosphate phosphatase
LLEVFKTELHVHTVLSPCADLEMIPPLIVAEALAQEIRLIAITDHNSSANIAAVQKAAAGSGLAVLPGMEVQTREEVHVLCLFDRLDQIEAWQAQVTAALPPLANDTEHFGEQFVVDETGDFIRREDQLLITSTSFSIHEAWERVNALGGLFIPAHVDRKAFGLIANLGFVPFDLAVDAVEISRHLQPGLVVSRFPQLKGLPFIRSGDAHRLEEFLGANTFSILEPSIAELRKAIKGEEGRSLVVV